MLLARDAICNRLQELDVPLPRGKRPGWIARKVKFKGLRRVPKVAAYDSEDFFDLLKRWMTSALDDPTVDAWVGYVDCGDVAGDGHDVAERFPAAFFEVLARRKKKPPWLQALFDRLNASDEKGKWFRERRVWAQSVLQGGVVGCGTTLAAGLAGSSTQELTAVGGRRPPSPLPLRRPPATHKRAVLRRSRLPYAPPSGSGLPSSARCFGGAP